MLPHPPLPPLSSPRPSRRGAPLGCCAGLLAALLAGCAGQPAEHQGPASPAGTASAPAPAQAARGDGPAVPGGELRTRNAIFRPSAFGELPGWDKDDIRAGWSAFRYSCEPLRRRDEWREICAAAKTVAPTERAMRQFFESNFTVLRILHPDSSREGDITGYFEPLLEGQPNRGGEFNVPVMGVPRDLYSLDWGKLPAAQRRSVIRVKPVGGRLLPLAAGERGGYAMDMRRFVLDDRDRRLRVRLVDAPGDPHVEPYHSRAEMEALGLPGGIDAPVLAWVDDPLALYAMQVQGSGRILQPDGSIIRLQYAEQNGHPFKPMRVVPKARPLTRGAAGPADAADEFVFEDQEAADGSGGEPPLTRGGRPAPAPAAAPDGLVDELLKGAKRPPPAAARPPAASPAAPAPAARLVEPRRAAVQQRLNSDPSFVFFKTVAERPRTEGPQGALGVPLTAGRSVAVDPRVTPLGYPMYLSAPAPAGSRVQVQRLVFAQDTGGAIRGALRADYFWGFGSEAGQLARSTRHRGQMWVLLPNGEAARLASSRLVTRGAAAPAAVDGQCLVADGEFCSEAAD